MNRKTFIQTSAAAAMSLVAFPTFYSCKEAKKIPRTIFDLLAVNKGNLATVRGNVSRFTNSGGTVGILETKEGFIVIDSQFPQTIQPLLDALAQKEGKSIQYLCNTHHHGDHTAGNIAFKDLTETIIAQQQVPNYQKIRAEEKGELDKQLYANTLFDKEHKIELGNDVVKAYHYGAGHTYGDAIYHFEQDNVVHMGDLMFNKCLPVFRPKDGSNVNQWINILDKVYQKFDDNTLFIYGHSYEPEFTTGKRVDLLDMKALLESSAEFMEEQMVSLGKESEQIIEEFSHIPGFEDTKSLWGAHWQDYISNLAESYKQK